jgi:hypothetical protein
MAGSYEHGNEPSDSIKCWEILEQLSNWWLFRKDSAPRSSYIVQYQQRISSWLLHEPQKLQIHPEIMAALVPAV